LTLLKRMNTAANFARRTEGAAADRENNLRKGEIVAAGRPAGITYEKQ
jgi:hypothetical protein